MKKRYIFLIVLGIFVLPLIFGLYDIELFRILEPRRENVKRKVFENTKSFVHGVQQDLGKYYNEYQKANESDRALIRSTIQMRFPQVDPDTLGNEKLANFLIETRGY